MRQFGDIRKGAEQVSWIAHQPVAQGKSTYRFRHGATNRYNENNTAMEKEMLQGPTQHRNALTRQLRRYIDGHRIGGIIRSFAMRQRDAPRTDEESAQGRNVTLVPTNRIIPPPPSTN